MLAKSVYVLIRHGLGVRHVHLEHDCEVMTYVFDGQDWRSYISWGATYMATHLKPPWETGSRASLFTMCSSGR